MKTNSTQTAAELIIQLADYEIKEGSAKEMWTEIAELVGTCSIKEHLEELEKVTTLNDVVEACQEYLENVKHRLITEEIRDDLTAKFLGVEVE